MDETKRRELAESGFIHRDTVIRGFADMVLKGQNRRPNISIGPVVWNVKAGHDVRHWYFMVGSADDSEPFRLDQLGVSNNEEKTAYTYRSALVDELLRHNLPLAVHVFDDELKMMRFCEEAFPCDKSRALRIAVERDLNRQHR